MKYLICMEGDAILEERPELFKKQEEFVPAQMDVLQKHLDKINNKVWYYETGIAAGTGSVHLNDSSAKEMSKMENKTPGTNGSHSPRRIR